MDFWHQVHASYLCQGPAPCESSGWVHSTSIRGSGSNTENGWKIGWHNLPSRTFILEGICWWCSKSKGLHSGASSGRYILISSNLLKWLNRTLAMPGPRTSCFGEINTHWHLLKWLNRILAMPGPRTSCFEEINTHWHLLKWLNRTLAMSGPRTSCFVEINTHWQLSKCLS